MMNFIQRVTDPMPTKLSYIVSTKLLLLPLLQYHCYHCYHYCCCYNNYQSYHITVLLITLLKIINLQVWLHWQLNSECLQIFFCSPCVESINLGWILYPRKLLRSPILVGYQCALPRGPRDTSPILGVTNPNLDLCQPNKHLRRHL